MSYASEDRDRVRPFVELLEREGWSVWWDRELVAGPSFDRDIETALDAAACVVVAWSRHSVDSDWCRAEAADGLQRGLLVPLRLDDVKAPLAFRNAQTADLLDWPRRDGEANSMLAGVRRVLNLAGTSAPTPARVKRTRHPTWRTATVAVIALALFGIWLASTPDAAAPTGSQRPDVSAAGNAPASSRPTVAVLPFEYLGGAQENAHLSDGLTEAIITALARFDDVSVIARNASRRYAGQAVDVREVSRNLGAAYVIQGSLQASAERVRVTVQLLDAGEGRHLWANTYDHDLAESDVFAVQDTISQQLVGTIAGSSGVISRARLKHLPTVPTQALTGDACLLAAAEFAFLHDDRDPAGFRSCLTHLAQTDPARSDAWAFLALIDLRDDRSARNTSNHPLEGTLRLAQRAVEADSTSQVARWALADTHFALGDLDAFAVEAERALAVNLNNPPDTVGNRHPVLLGWGCLPRCNHPSAAPFIPALALLEGGRPEQALIELRKVESRGNFWLEVHLAAVYAVLDRRRDAGAALDRLHVLYPGLTLAQLGEELRMWNVSEERINFYTGALRRAGLT